jgi:hypothetical protein
MSSESGGPKNLQRAIVVLLALILVSIVGLIIVVVARPGVGPSATSTASRPAGQTSASSTVPPASVLATPVHQPAERDGLYVDGLFLDGGVSRSRVLEVLGTEDERYGSQDQAYFAWNRSDGSYITVQFDGVGSLQSATVAVPEGKKIDASTYASLEGTRVIPGQDTLGEIMGAFPGGVLGALLPGEGTYMRDYRVVYGGEGSEQMDFSVGWDMGAKDKNLAGQKRLKLSSITVGYPQDEGATP